MHAFQHEEIESSNAFKAEEAQKRAQEAGRWHNVLASKVSSVTRSAPLCICVCLSVSLSVCLAVFQFCLAIGYFVCGLYLYSLPTVGDERRDRRASVQVGVCGTQVSLARIRRARSPLSPFAYILSPLSGVWWHLYCAVLG